MRDLCRARADMVADRTRARHRLGKFLLRHGRIWRGGENWTLKHHRWISQQHFDEAALEATFAHYRATLQTREAAVDAIDTDLAVWFGRGPFDDAVSRLSAYRGITELGALTLATEVCDWRRFPTASMFMGFCGLVPSESSSGDRTQRGGITHAGNAAATIIPQPGASRVRPPTTRLPGASRAQHRSCAHQLRNPGRPSFARAPSSTTGVRRREPTRRRSIARSPRTATTWKNPKPWSTPASARSPSG